MVMDDKYTFGSRGFQGRRILLFACLLFVMLLIFSGTFYVVSMRSDKNFSPEVSPNIPPIVDTDTQVASEDQLRNAVNIAT
jgi:hypothetical protein